MGKAGIVGRVDDLSSQLATMSQQLSDNTMQIITTSNAVASLTNAVDGVGEVTSIEGRTLVNLLNDAGNCEDLSKWFKSGAVALDTLTKLYNNSSIRIASSVASIYYDNIITNVSHKYFVSAYTYISSYTNGSVYLQSSIGGSWNNSEVTVFDTSRLNVWQRKSHIVSNQSSIRINIANDNTSVFNVDGVMLYDLTAMGLDNITDITELERLLPFVDGIGSVQVNCVKTRGKNVFDVRDPLKKDTVYSLTHYQGRECLTWKDNGNAYLVGPYFEGFFKENTQYTFQITGITDTDSTHILIQYTDGTSDTITFNSSGFTTYVTSSKLNKTISGIQSNWEGGKNVYIDINSTQIEEGTTATPYEPYTESVITLPSQIVDLKAIGSVKDTYNPISGEWVKSVEINILTNADVYAMVTNYTGVDYAMVVEPNTAFGYGTGRTGVYFVEGYVETTNTDYNTSINIGKYMSNAVSNYLWVGFPKGTTLGQARTALVGKRLLYLLETPTITIIPCDGVLESYPNGSLIVDSNIPCNVTYRYPSNIGESIKGLNDAVNAMSDSLGGAWETLLILADKELQMSSIDPLTTETTADLKAKINEIIGIWG